MSEFTACDCGRGGHTRNDDVTVTVCSECRRVKYDHSGVTDAIGIELEQAKIDAYARGKADGLAEAEARIIAWVRGEANEGYNEIQIADALERGEHKK